MIDLRLNRLTDWLDHLGKKPSEPLQVLAGDASFRRYVRIQHAGTSYIVMDAPPERENCVPFVAIAQGLKTLSLQTPDIIASDMTRGFLLLSDFGDRLYLNELNATNANELYTLALNDLAKLQSCREIAGWTIPLFTMQFMRQELDLFKEWFLHKHLNLLFSRSTEMALAACFDALVKNIADQPKVFMHRDFHSANLMCLPEQKVGILDFQDAFMGPVTYDLASLLRDCYIAWPDEWVRQWVAYYKHLLKYPVSDAEFMRWFDEMGLQRHMKALLTFSRKLHRDHDSRYLKHIPRTVNYILRVSEQYPEYAALTTLMNEVSLCGA